MKIVIATIKSWNIQHGENLKHKYKDRHEIKIITEREKLNLEMLDFFRPDFIFFPHWSYRIPESIYGKYTCVVFHMTDLPFGRGGSPLQNLIVRGIKETKISAIQVQKEMDAGPVYMKEKLSLEGSAGEIFQRASDIIFEKMIPRFWEETILPEDQKGEPVIFKRRTEAESELNPDMDLPKIYDYIRMLDGEGYPNAFLYFGKYKLSFWDARLSDGRLSARVMIEEKSEQKGSKINLNNTIDVLEKRKNECDFGGSSTSG